MTRWFALAMVAVVGGCSGHGGRERTQGTSASAASVSVLYPPDPCVLPSEMLRVVALVDGAGEFPRLTLDGRPLDVRRLRLGWTPKGSRQQFSPSSKPSDGPSDGPGQCSSNRAIAGLSVLVATTSLDPGEHRVGAGKRHVRVFVRVSGNGAAAPADWPVFRLHPPPDPPGRPVACSTCHDITETSIGPLLGRPQTPDDCFSCHPPDDFELTHTHRVEVLTACETCHEPHGGTRPALLKDTAKALCSTCHE